MGYWLLKIFEDQVHSVLEVIAALTKQLGLVLVPKESFHSLILQEFSYSGQLEMSSFWLACRCWCSHCWKDLSSRCRLTLKLASFSFHYIVFCSHEENTGKVWKDNLRFGYYCVLFYYVTMQYVLVYTIYIAYIYNIYTWYRSMVFLIMFHSYMQSSQNQNQVFDFGFPTMCDSRKAR